MATAGSANFDVRINQEGLNKDLALSSKKISQLTEQFNKQVISIKKQTAAIEDLQRKLAAITTLEKQVASITAMESQLKRVTAETANITKQNQDLIAQYDRAVQLADSMQAAGFTPEQMTQAVSEIDRLAAQLQPVWQALDESEKRAQELRDRIAELKLDPANSAEAKNLADKIAIASEQLELSKSKANELKDTLQVAFLGTNFKEYSKAVQQLNTDLKNANEEIQRLQNLIATETDPVAINKLRTELEQANIKSSELNNQLEKLKGAADTRPVNNFSSALQGTSMSARQMGAALGMAISGAGTLRGIISALSGMLFMMGGTMDIVKIKATAMWAAITLGVSLAINGITKLIEMFKETIDRYKDAIKNIGTTINKLPNIAKSAINKIQNIFTIAIKSIGKSIDNIFKKLINLAKLNIVFNQLQDAIKNVSDIIIDTILANKDFENSLNSIKANLSTAFQPIYETILPALNTLMTWLARATQYAAAFISMLFGKTYQQSLDAAKAINEQAEAMKNLDKSNKKAGKSLASFDVINQQSMQTAEESAAFIQFPDFDMPDFTWLNDFAEKLKSIMDIIDIEYWGDLGKKISNWIAEQLEKIDWNTIRKKANILGQNIGALLGEILGNAQMWANIGTTIAQSFNTALEFLNGVATTFPWIQVGKALATGINSIVNVFDAKLFADTFNKWAIGILDLLISAVTTINWFKLGQKIVDMLNNIKWIEILTKVGITIRDSLIGILTSLHKIFIDNQWALDIASGLAKGLNKVLSDRYLLREAGQTLGAAINTLLKSIATFAKEFKWKEAAAAIANGLIEMISAVKPQDVADAINAIVNGIYEFLVHFFETVPPERILEIAESIVKSIDFKKVLEIIDKIDEIKQIPDKIFDMIIKEMTQAKVASFIDKLIAPFAGMEQAIYNFLAAMWGRILGEDLTTPAVASGEAIVDGFAEGLKKPFDPLQRFKDFIQGVKNLFGIKSPSTVFAEIGKNIMQGLLNGITGLAKNVLNFFKDLVKNLKSAFSDIADYFKKIFNDAWTNIQSIWKNVSKWFNDNVTKPITDFFTKMWDTVKKLAETTWSGIRTAWNVASSWFNSTIITPITNFFTTMWNKIKQLATDTWNAIKTIWNVVASWFTSTVINPITNFFTNMWNIINNLANVAWNAIRTVWNTASSWFNSTVISPISNFFSNLWNGIQRGAQSMQDGFRRVFEGLINIVKSPINAIIDMVNRMISGVISGINSVIRAANKIGGIRISTISTPSIQRLATGGVVGHGLYELGENGAEAVVPLENNTGWINKVAAQMASQLENFSINPTITNNLVERGRQQQTYTPFGAGSMDWIDDLADAIILGLSGIQTTGTSQAQTNVTVELDGRELGRMILPYTQEEQTRLGGRISNRRLATT